MLQPRGPTGIEASVRKSANETCEEIRGRDPCTELYRTGPPPGEYMAGVQGDYGLATVSGAGILHGTTMVVQLNGSTMDLHGTTMELHGTTMYA